MATIHFKLGKEEQTSHKAQTIAPAEAGTGDTVVYCQPKLDFLFTHFLALAHFRKTERILDLTCLLYAEEPQCMSKLRDKTFGMFYTSLIVYRERGGKKAKMLPAETHSNVPVPDSSSDSMFSRWFEIKLSL